MCFKASMSSTCNSIINLKVIDEIVPVLSLYSTIEKLDSASENPANHCKNSSEWSQEYDFLGEYGIPESFW